MKRAITLQEAKDKYVHRYTMEHMPTWAKTQCADGKYYAPQYRSDREWYERTYFPGEATVDSSSKYCQSNCPSWPLGQWLDAPYK